MQKWEKMYYKVFRAVSETLDMLGEQNYGSAKQRLVQLQKELEEYYIEHDENAQ